MSLDLVRAVARMESADDIHLARILILLADLAEKNHRPVDGIMKLAKLDFLLRYPNCLERALNSIGEDSTAVNLQAFERNTIESKMVRFRFGPWDSRYRRWIGLLIARGLCNTYLKGKTVCIELTDSGLDITEKIKDLPDFTIMEYRSKLVSKAFGSYSGSKLKEFVYKVFPEIIDMKWGESIQI